MVTYMFGCCSDAAVLRLNGPVCLYYFGELAPLCMDIDWCIRTVIDFHGRCSAECLRVNRIEAEAILIPIAVGKSRIWRSAPPGIDV